jgi:hypothetical protein
MSLAERLARASAPTRDVRSGPWLVALASSLAVIALLLGSA